MRAVAGRATLIFAIGWIAAIACARHTVDSGVNVSPAADSIVLERTRCFGFCPAYRLSVARGGRVTFESRDPRESGRRATGTVPSAAFARLMQRVNEIEFSSLPDTIQHDPILCPRVATDMPTAIVSVYARDTVDRIVDYHGCFTESDRSGTSRLLQLRAFEAGIDSVTGSSRWLVKPNVSGRAP